MASRNKLSLWLTLAVLLVVAFGVPLVTDKSWSSIFNAGVEQYLDAAERASQIGEEEDDDDEREDGEPMRVEIDDEVKNSAGIELMSLQQDLYYPESRAYASVVDVRDLIQWRTRLKQLEVELELAQMEERAQLQELNRLRKLAEATGSIASKNINYAESNWQQARAKRQAAELALEAARTELTQGWGAVIASWVSEQDSKEFERLVTRQDTLIQITLPVALSLPADVNVIRVSRQGQRENARKAYFVSPAFVANYAAQGETYYFKMATGKLRLGMRLHAWIPRNAEGLQGFFIPERAIVWYSGKPWTYIQQDELVYRRRPLAEGEAVAGGIFIQSEFEEGESLVVAGSQMLLSEEFSWQILDEDDD
jgi:hypothetical protein